MRQHRIKDFDPRVWAWGGPGDAVMVFMELGRIRFSSTADEAEKFAGQLLQAAKEARNDS